MYLLDYKIEINSSVCVGQQRTHSHTGIHVGIGRTARSVSQLVVGMFIGSPEIRANKSGARIIMPSIYIYNLHLTREPWGMDTVDGGRGARVSQ